MDIASDDARHGPGAETCARDARAPARLTLLTHSHALAAKRFFPGGVEPFGKGARFAWREEILDNFDALARLLRRLETEERTFAVLGRVAELWRNEAIVPRTKRARGGEAPGIADTGSRVIHFDYDEERVPAGMGWHHPGEIAEHVAELLRQRVPAFRGVRLWWQASSSAGVPGKAELAKFHIWAMLDEPIDEAQRKRLLRLAQADEALASCNAAQYTAAPIFDGVPNPLDGVARSGEIPGEADFARVADILLPELPARAARRATGEPRPAPAPPPETLHHKTSEAGARILAHQCERIASAQAGGRNVLINRIAFTIGGHVAGGTIAYSDALAALLRAGEASGHARYREAVENGLRDGMAWPIPQETRDTRGRFSGAGAREAEPLAMPDFASPDEARRRIAQAVQDFLVEAAAWHRIPEDERGPAPVLALAAYPGAGKSRIAREVLAEFPPDAFGNADVIFHAPTLALAEEAARHARELRAGWHVTRGRSARQPGSTAAMCARAPLAERVAKAGLRVSATLCERKTDAGETSLCPHHAGCAYMRQWRELGHAPALRFSASAYVPLAGDGSGRRAGLRVIDETIFSAFTRIADVTLDRWQRPRGDELAEASRAVVAALESGRLDGLPYTAEELRGFAAQERAPDVLPVSPGAPDDALDEALSRYETGAADAGKRAAIWELLAQAVERGGTTERLRIVRDVPAPGTGEPRDVIRATWLAVPARAEPTLLLDADAQEEIVERLYPGARVERIAMRPNAHVVQVSDKTFSKAALQRQTTRADAVALVRHQSRLDRLAGGGGTLAVASKAVVAAIFADAGMGEIDDAAMLATELHGARWLWFGPRILGANDFRDFTTCVIIGREELPLSALQDGARALFGDTGEPLALLDERPGANMPESAAPYLMADGSGAAVDIRQHPDPRVRALQAQRRELATRQAVERLRLATHTGTPKRIIIASKIPIPGLPVNELRAWHDVAPSRLARAMAEAQERSGILRLSAAGMAEDAPETFPSRGAAHQWLIAGGGDEIKWVGAGNKVSLAAPTHLNRGTLRIPGQRGKATPVLFLREEPLALAQASFGAGCVVELAGIPSAPAPNHELPDTGKGPAREFLEPDDARETEADFSHVIASRDKIENASDDNAIAAFARCGGIIPPALRPAARRLQREAGWRQDELAARIQISRAQLANALQGRFGLSPAPAKALVELISRPPPVSAPLLL